MNVVSIHAAGGRESGMKVLFYLPDTSNGNVARQQFIEFISQLFFIQRCWEIEVCNHHPCMDSRIGTSRPCHHYLLS